MARVQHLIKETFVLVCVIGFTVGLFGFGNQVVTRHAWASRPAVPPGGSSAAAEKAETVDKTLSPYFFVKSDQPDLDQLPLKSTSAVVNVAGVIADVKVTQVYRNEGKRSIEAVYVFPASTRAAVYGMKMTIGERVIVAKIQKREEARAAYEQAKQQGRSASLLEQQRPNVFQMNVANILPGDEITTELSYTELLTPTEGVYELVYPTVVGPRYSNQKAEQAPPSEKWVANPYLHEKQPPTYTFDIKVRLAAGMPIQEMVCTSHTVDIRYDDPSRARVTLASTDQFGGNKDFILKYRLAGERIESGLLLYQGEDENFFLLMAQPPKRATLAAIPQREYIFIVDVSGSMHGFPLEVSKTLLKNLIGGLRPSDSFNVLLFSGGSQLMNERSLPATPENVRKAIDLIEHQKGGGGTELLPALQRALALPRPERTARTMIIATDGYVTVEPEAFDLIRKHLGDANFFAFGIGSSVNRLLIEGMARAGAGEPFVLANANEAPARAEEFRRYVESPLLTRIKLDFNGFETYDVEPASVPDVFAERPVIVYGKWRGQPQGSISLKGISGEHNYERTIDVASIQPLASNSALRSLWARSAVTRLSDYNFLQPSDDRIAQVTDLGLKYSLLTAYTSFVAVDTQVRAKGGDLTTVQQPLPLPEGVSDYAVGGGTGGAPVASRAMGKLAAPPSIAMPYHAEHAAEPARDSTQRSGSMARSDKAKVPASGASGDRSAQEFSAGEENDGRDELKDAEKSAWKVKIERLSVAGGLSDTAVRRVIEANLPALLACLPTGHKPGAADRVTVKWTIDAEGNAVNAKPVAARPSARVMGKCLVEGIKGWRFETPARPGATVTVTFLFELGGT
jgi:Ca-activated chloride channel family protein